MRTDKEMAWKTLESTYLIRRPWLTARRDSVMLPDGRVNNEYYALEYPDWINIVAITRDRQMLLERQWRHAAAEVSTEIPAGVIEEGEEPLAAAQRELLEETGFGGGRWQLLLTTRPNSSTKTNQCFSFLAEDVEPIGARHLDATEDLDVMLRPIADVRRMLEEGIFHQAMMVAPLWKYFALQKA